MPNPQPKTKPASRVRERPEPAAATRRGNDRIDALISAALDAFWSKGFHGTNINEIGAAAGVTGPALYRHFKSKHELLAETIWMAVRLVARAGRSVRERDLPARDALNALCEIFVDVAVDNPKLLAVYALEARHLPADLAVELKRNERLFREEFVHLITTIRPDVIDADARALVRGALFVVIGACLEETGMDKGRAKRLLTKMMVATLGAAT